jgi:hypothetical protein
MTRVFLSTHTFAVEDMLLTAITLLFLAALEIVESIREDVLVNILEIQFGTTVMNSFGW